MKTAGAGGRILEEEQEATPMRKAILAVLGVGVLALGVGPAAAFGQPAPPPGEHGPGMGPAGRMARFLGLTDQQQADIRKLMEGQRADHQALWEKLKANREAMKQALDNANPDPAAVGELAIEAHKLHQQMQALRDAQDKAIRDLLTPDQRLKFDAMKALRPEGMGMGGPRGAAFGLRHGGGPERP
jgi:Spy/CpxP family protein refolding chaperone